MWRETEVLSFSSLPTRIPAVAELKSVSRSQKKCIIYTTDSGLSVQELRANHELEESWGCISEHPNVNASSPVAELNINPRYPRFPLDPASTFFGALTSHVRETALPHSVVEPSSRPGLISSTPELASHLLPINPGTTLILPSDSVPLSEDPTKSQRHRFVHSFDFIKPNSSPGSSGLPTHGMVVMDSIRPGEGAEFAMTRPIREDDVAQNQTRTMDVCEAPVTVTTDVSQMRSTCKENLRSDGMGTEATRKNPDNASDMPTAITARLYNSGGARIAHHGRHRNVVCASGYRPNSVMRRLPPEIFSIIFAHCLEPDTIHSLKLTLSSLTQICGLWRDMVIATPQLWSLVPLDLSRKTWESELCYVKMWLLRSGDCPISIQLGPEWNGDKIRNHPAVGLLLLQIHRWKHIDLQSSRILSHCLTFLPAHLPYLTSFRVQATTSALVLQLLGRCPNLVDCHLRIAPHNDTPAIQPLTMLQLRSLEIEVDSEEALIFDSLTLPALRRLRLRINHASSHDSWTACPVFISCISRSKCLIEQFTMWGGPIPSMLLPYCLRKMNTLKCLRLLSGAARTLTNDSLIQLEFLPSLSNWVPNLAHFEIQLADDMSPIDFRLKRFIESRRATLRTVLINSQEGENSDLADQFFCTFAWLRHYMIEDRDGPVRSRYIVSKHCLMSCLLDDDGSWISSLVSYNEAHNFRSRVLAGLFCHRILLSIDLTSACHRLRNPRY